MQAERLEIGTGNEEQAAAWDGDEGTQWAAHPQFYDDAVRHHHARLLEAAAISSTEHVLDIGCGNGQTTLDAASAADPGHAVGIDLSSQMIERARALAAARGSTNVAFVHGDAQVHPLGVEAFDVGISRFGSMFFADPAAAFSNIRRSLRPGARLLLMSWQAPPRNEWISSFGAALTLGKPMPAPPPDAPGPFSHADPQRPTQTLEAAGFADARFEALEPPMYFGADADEGFAILSELMAWMIRDLDADGRATALGNLRRVLEDHQTDEGVAFGSAAWLITARNP